MKDNSQKHKKVLEITFNSPTCHCGGIEDATLNLIKEFLEVGYKVTSLFCSGDWDSDHIEKDSLEIVRFSTKNRIMSRGPLAKVLFNLWILVYLMKYKKSFDIIHFNGDNGGLSSLIFRNGSVHSVPGLSFSKGRTLYGKLSFPKRSIVGLIYFPSMIFEFLGLIFAEKVVCDNVYSMEMVKKFLKKRSEKVMIIPNSVDDKAFFPVTSPIEREQTKKELGLDGDFFYATWVGTNPYNYGLDTAIEAILKANKKWNLIVVGPMQEIKDKRIHYVGFQDHVSLGKYYRSSLVFLFPKRYEGIELAVISAMLCGAVPILDSKFSPRYFTTDEVFFTGSVEEIVDLLNRISEYPGMLENKSEKAIERARKQTPATVASQYLEMFTSLNPLNHTVVRYRK